ERCALPRRQLRGRPSDKAPTDGTLARATALQLRTDRVQTPRVLPRRDADEHLLDGPAIERIRRRHRLKRRQRDLAGGCPRPRTSERHFPAPPDALAVSG